MSPCDHSGCVGRRATWHFNIKQNIAFGESRENIDIERVNRVIKECELDDFVKLFDNSKDFKHTNYSIMRLIKDNPDHSNKMRSWLNKQDQFLISYEEFKKQNK